MCPQQTINDSQELRLTLLIEALFDWLVQAKPMLLFYGQANLRHALECYFYFTTIKQPAGLMPLLRATSDWRTKSIGIEDLAALVSTYDYFMKSAQDNAIEATCRRNVRALYIKLGTIKNRFRKQVEVKKAYVGPKKVIVFFAVNTRYVNFFDRVISKIGKSSSAFITLGEPEVTMEIKSINAHVLDSQNDHLNSANINMHCFNPLYPEYMTLLKQYLLAVGTLKEVKARAVVFAEGTSIQDALVACAAKALGIPTIRIQSGRAGILHSAYRNMPFDHMLVWGEGMAARLREFSPKAEYVLTGNPDIQPSTDDESLLMRRFFTKKSKVLTVFTQPINTDLKSSEYDLLIRLVVEVLKRENKLVVLVRKHPADQYMGFEEIEGVLQGRLKVTLTQDATLQKIIAASDLTLGFYSTTLSESAAYGLPAVILQLRKEHKVFPFPELHGAAIAVDSEEAACLAIHKILHDTKYMQSMNLSMKKFADHYFGPRDGLAINRIIEHIMRIAV